MFTSNDNHTQRGMFDGERLLAPSLRNELRDSWATTFYHQVFSRIDESLFADLYSDAISRPNAPVNVLLGMDILKSGFGWSDRTLDKQVKFNVEVRHALGLRDMTEVPPTLRTLYNFRRRVREKAEESGVNLYQKACQQVTDEQMETIGLSAEWQRMDSTQVLSNLAKMSRLQFMIATLAKIADLMPAPLREEWGEALAPYIEKRPRKIAYEIPADEVEEHLQEAGKVLARLTGMLMKEAPESEVAGLAKRVFSEQYEVVPDPDGGEETLRLRAPTEISTSSVQSPHDPEATYRRKGGETYRGGYVVNISETCDPENFVQLITDLQVAPNNTDDGALMAQSLQDQEKRDIEVRRATTDGGYTGPTGESACSSHDVTLRPTRMRGGKPAPDGQSLSDYTWETDAEGAPTSVTCPKGQTATVQPTRGDGRYIARFEEAVCETCPLFANGCRVDKRKRTGPTLYVSQQDVRVALRRQNLYEGDRSIRASVEATVRSVKHPCTTDDKLRVRGLARTTMVMNGAAMMVNMRRLHQFWLTFRELVAQLAYHLAYMLILRFLSCKLATDLFFSRHRIDQTARMRRTRNL